MGLMGLLFKFTAECFAVVSWPLFALGYPLYASVQAIETKSNSDTQKLITYWVCFALILLFDAFVKPLQWLPPWPYVKLIIIGCLVFPHFDGSLYVYKHLVHPCLSLNPHTVYDWFIKFIEFVNQDNRPVEMNKGAKETGSVASENLLAFEPKVEESKDLQKETNPVAILGKKEATSSSSTKQNLQVGHIEPDLSLPGSNTCASLEIKDLLFETITGKHHADACGILKATNQTFGSKESPASAEISAPPDSGCDHPDKSHSMTIQNPYSCAVCKLTIKNKNRKPHLASHFLGRRHEKSLEKLKAKIEASRSKSSSGIELCDPLEVAGVNHPGKPDSNSIQMPWICGTCRVTIWDETSLVSHLQGKRHKDTCEKLKALIQPSKADNVSVWCCNICNFSCNNEIEMEGHFNGSKHLAKIAELCGVGGSGQA